MMYAGMPLQRFRWQERTAEEREILENIEKALNVTDKLSEMGEIYESDYDLPRKPSDWRMRN